MTDRREEEDRRGSKDHPPRGRRSSDGLITRNLVRRIIGAYVAAIVILVTGFAITLNIQADDRKNARENLCHSINSLVFQTNYLNDYFQDLIVSGVRDSKKFSAIYKQFHLPTYSTRLHQALMKAADLEARKNNKIDCSTLRAITPQRGSP